MDVLATFPGSAHLARLLLRAPPGMRSAEGIASGMAISRTDSGGGPAEREQPALSFVHPLMQSTGGNDDASQAAQIVTPARSRGS